ncbi:MAG: DUF2330 domain-containing protein [Phycisphaerae bacterium]|nr:DUF2330 domain-containing protein [Phycisphaerae bacterium]NIP54475.1 DUF2330 domain-containing protein [Phycisphaerae bacterium]NIS53992.1 DUF2330 domain-containing protein [Phycisphaerae bacterium]NIU11601.1 DUF2330 domain-containing protein [Phycisphaerae bacterium]NIU58647.1 DUF2330 domain-containing protein [Phycisphaerae bacterium]
MYKSETTQRYSYICIIGVLLTVFFVPPKTCPADKGGWHLSTKPVTLTESGQRAIVGWGGETEILCLATDVSSSEKTKVIEFLPLPSEPNVALGSKDTFEAVEKLLARRDVKFFKERTSKGGGGGGLLEVAEPFRITFHKRLGAHDVTVVKVNRPDDFADWVQEKARALTGGQVSLPDSIRKLISKYLNKYNCPYFVFDVIEVGPDPQSVEPIIYEFKSPVVFYPLEISSTFHGNTSIDLVVFSRYLVDRRPFQERMFLLSNFAEVSASDMKEVFPRLNQLLGKSAFVQAFRYTGRIDRLRGNITAGPATEHIGIGMEQYGRARRWSFNSGIITGMVGGVLVAFICLSPMYFSAKHQRPRWWLRLLLGFLLGMPLGFVFAFYVMYMKGYLPTREYIYQYPFSLMQSSRDYLFLVISPLVTFYIFSMGMGFIIFCFQLGLRRRWYIWCLVYVALAIPVSYIGQPLKFLGLFNRSLLDSWLNLGEMGPWIIMHMAVFVALFLIARLLVWITGPRKTRRSSLSR